MGILDAIPILIMLAIIGGVIYAIYAWRKRGPDPGADHDPGMGR